MTAVTKDKTPQLQWQKLANLTPGKYQPRQFFDDVYIKELAASIALHGVLQPLLIDENGHIIAGECRFRAAKYIGLNELPCIQIQLPESKKSLLAILENIQRAQLEPLEEALSYQRLQIEYAWTHEHIASLLGKSRAHVSNMLRLLGGGELVLQALKDKYISYGHVRALLPLKEQRQVTLLDWTIKNKASVRMLEQKIKLVKNKDVNVSEHAHFLQTLSHQVGAPVELELGQHGQGFLKFKYFDQETLQGLLQKLGLSYD